MFIALDDTRREVEIESQSPLIGLTGIVSYTDTTVIIGAGTVNKFFKYSYDTVNWCDEWVELSDTNLTNLTPKPNLVFRIKYKYVLVEATFADIRDSELVCTYSEQAVPDVFDSYYMSSMITYWNSDSLRWYANVLTKIYKEGILPSYIKRGDNVNMADQDFLDLWFPIIYFHALVYAFNRKLSDVFHDKALLERFLINRGLTPSDKDSLAENQYLAQSYYKQLAQRGTFHINDLITAGDPINGELIRLLVKLSTDEFIFIKNAPYEISWNIGRSSPLYKGWDLVNEATKQTYTADNTSNSRIGESSPNINDSVIVDKNLAYKLSFDIEVISSETTRVNLDLKGFSNSDSSLSFFEAGTSSDSSAFFHYDDYVFKVGEVYRVSVYLLELDNTFSGSPFSDMGNHLQFKDNAIIRIEPHLLITKADGSSSSAVISNFNVSLLKSKNSRYFVNNYEFLYLYYINNGNLNDTKLGEFIKTNLIPYRDTLMLSKIR